MGSNVISFFSFFCHFKEERKQRTQKKQENKKRTKNVTNKKRSQNTQTQQQQKQNAPTFFFFFIFIFIRQTAMQPNEPTHGYTLHMLFTCRHAELASRLEHSTPGQQNPQHKSEGHLGTHQNTIRQRLQQRKLLGSPTGHDLWQRQPKQTTIESRTARRLRTRITQRMD